MLILCDNLIQPMRWRDPATAAAISSGFSAQIRSAGPGKNTDADRSAGGALVETADPEVKKPPLFKVLLLNDDYTPMEFVVDVLERFFRMDRNTATRVMLEVHVSGKGVCGVFTYEIAETKVAHVLSYSREHQHPLMCTLEEA